MMKYAIALCLFFGACTFAFHFDETLCGDESSYPCTRDLRSYCFADGSTKVGCEEAYNYQCLNPAMTYTLC